MSDPNDPSTERQLIVDPVKQAFVNEVRESLRKTLDASGFQSVDDQYTEAINVEMRDVSSLITEFRINQGPHKGPRYFDVIVRERF